MYCSNNTLYFNTNSLKINVTQLTRFISTIKHASRSLLCGILKLTSSIACYYWKSNTINIYSEGINPHKMKRCLKSWNENWARHCKIEKVKMYHTEGDKLEYLYSNSDKDKVTKCMYIILIAYDIFVCLSILKIQLNIYFLNRDKVIYSDKAPISMH